MEVEICLKLTGDSVIYRLSERDYGAAYGQAYRFYPEKAGILTVFSGNYHIFKRFYTIREALADAIGWDPRYLKHTDITLKVQWVEINGKKTTDFEFMDFQ